MRKVVSLRYPDFCYACGKTMPIGTLVIWKGKKGGVFHYPGCMNLLGKLVRPTST